VDRLLDNRELPSIAATLADSQFQTEQRGSPMRRFIVVISVFLWSLTAAALEIHSPAHCLYGCPEGGPDTNDLVIREIYILNSNDKTKFADWVAYRITSDTIGRTKQRQWLKDPLLADNETLSPSDYDGANEKLSVDRGHQATLTSFTGTQYWKDTNILSNITPQKAELNQGPWERLERATRGCNKVCVNGHCSAP
jgi:endonuclease G